MTKLDIINAMLASLGESPLNELDARHPVVSSGLRIIAQKTKTIQLNSGAGWWFNKLPKYTLKLDVNNRIAVPQDLLSYSTDYPNRLGIKSGYLFDLDNDTDVFTAPVSISAIRDVEYTDLPNAILDCIAYEAIFDFSRDNEGDTEKMKSISRQAERSWIAARSQNIREQKANTQRNPQIAYALSNIQHLLYR
jgi:hypothetical protein